jgi:hypothetical protein
MGDGQLIHEDTGHELRMALQAALRQAMADSLRQNIAVLRSTLSRYGGHTADCQHIPCTCGWDSPAIRALRLDAN